MLPKMTPIFLETTGVYPSVFQVLEENPSWIHIALRRASPELEIAKANPITEDIMAVVTASLENWDNKYKELVILGEIACSDPGSCFQNIEKGWWLILFKKKTL